MKFVPATVKVPRISGRAPDEKTPEQIEAEAAAVKDAEIAAAAAAAVAAEEAEQKRLQDEAEAAELAAEATRDAKTLATEKAKLVREVMDKKAKLKEADKKAADAAAALAAYEGVDPAKVRELLRKESDAEKSAAEAKGDFERVKAMMVEEHGKETKTLSDRIAELQSAVVERDSAIVKLTIGNDFGSSTFIRDTLTLTPAKARQLYGAHFEIQDGRTVAFDKPAGSAARTMLVDATGTPLPFDAAFKRIIEADPDKDTLLRATVHPGAGSRTTSADTTAREKAAETDGLFGASRIAAALRAK